MEKKYRAAVIGSTGKGGYGHGLDLVCTTIENIDIAAVADADPEGLRAAGERLEVEALYPDYRDMLEREKPDLVCIGPGWVAERAAMVPAAARAGCHIYCEKPFAGHLEDADAMMDACSNAGIQIAVAHQLRAMPPVRRTLEDVQRGTYGKLLSLRARPKDDHRGGGEELIVHGTHLFDLMIAFAGPPQWVSGHIGVAGRDASREDQPQGTTAVGPIVGDSLSAAFGFAEGVRGFFDSTAHLDRPERSLYGLLVECEEAILYVRTFGDVYRYPAPVVLPEKTDFKWEKVWVDDWHFTAAGQPRPLRDWLHRGNEVLIRELLGAIEAKGAPSASGRDAHLATEMIQGVYASHFAAGRRLPLPLADRRHPLEKV